LTICAYILRAMSLLFCSVGGGFDKSRRTFLAANSEDVLRIKPDLSMGNTAS